MPYILLVDFKYSENNGARIVEYGCGFNSSFKGYAKAHGNEDLSLFYQLILKKLV